MVHISLHTHGTFYLFVCAVNVCTLLGNKISINQKKKTSDQILKRPLGSQYIEQR